MLIKLSKVGECARDLFPARRSDLTIHGRLKHCASCTNSWRRREKWALQSSFQDASAIKVT
jgi:hypothetical protein